MQAAPLLTFRGEPQLSAGHRGISIVPQIIADTAPPSTYTHLHSPLQWTGPTDQHHITMVTVRIKYCKEEIMTSPPKVAWKSNKTCSTLADDTCILIMSTVVYTEAPVVALHQCQVRSLTRDLVQVNQTHPRTKESPSDGNGICTKGTMRLRREKPCSNYLKMTIICGY